MTECGSCCLSLACKTEPLFADLAFGAASRNHPFKLLAAVPFLHVRQAVSGKCNWEQVLGKGLNQEASGT